MKKIILFILFGFTAFNLKAQLVSYFVQADADDWQLFMSTKAIADLQAGGKTVFVTLTAGDEGYGEFAYNGSSLPYFSARENGAVYSCKFIWDILQSGPNSTATPVVQTVIISGHQIKKYVYNRTVAYFLRLPDGNFNGHGYPTTTFKSLKKFKTGESNILRAVDGSTVYTSWADLTATIAAIFNTERGTNLQAWLHTASLDSVNVNPILNNANDHSDHYYASKAAQDAANTMLWIGINEFINNRSSLLPANLPVSDVQNSTSLFAVADWPLVLNKYPFKFNAINKALLAMDYAAVKRLPIPTSLPVSLLNFTGQLFGANILLNWSTASELNSKFFEIEWSKDGVEYKKIAQLSTAGNSNVQKNYSYTDLGAAPVNYYRLKMIDLDGSTKTSNVVIVKRNALKQAVTVLQNPFADKISIRFAQIPKGKITVQLTDVAGRQIASVVYSNWPLLLLNFDNFKAAGISSGMYVLQIKADGDVYTFKIKKQ